MQMPQDMLLSADTLASRAFTHSIFLISVICLCSTKSQVFWLDIFHNNVLSFYSVAIVKM